jgi:hypothetical protein
MPNHGGMERKHENMRYGLIQAWLISGRSGARYEIVEVNGDRAIIEFICDLPIPPQSVAMVSELEIVHGQRVLSIANRQDKRISLIRLPICSLAHGLRTGAHYTRLYNLTRDELRNTPFGVDP